MFPQTNKASQIANATTLSSFLFLWLYEQLNDEESVKRIQQKSQNIILIASLQYMYSLTTTNQDNAELVRYIDWLFTTPLLLEIYAIYAEEKGGNDLSWSSYAKVANVVMISTGLFAYETTGTLRIILYVISFLCMFVVFWYLFSLYRENYAHFNWKSTLIFLVPLMTYPLYGLNALSPTYVNGKYNQGKSIIYSTMDALNKATMPWLIYNDLRQ